MSAISGTAGNDTLAGTFEADELFGLDGNDRIAGGAGDDVLEGGTGTDIAVFAGTIADYRFGQADGYLIVTDINPTNGDEGSDWLRGIEVLQFAGTRIGVAGNGEARVNDTTFDFQSRASAVRLDDGGQLITWISHDAASDTFNVLGQRYAPDGAPRSAEFRINSEALDQPLADDKPAVAALADGGFVVAWTLVPVDFGDTAVRAQRFDAHAAPVDDEFQVNTTVDGSQERPVVAGLDDGGFVVCWSSYAQDGDGFGVFAQRYEADGAAAGGEIQLNQHTDDAQVDPDIAALPDGGFIAVWRSHDQDDGNDGIYARRFDGSGSALGDEFRVNTSTSSEHADAAIAVRADGTCAIAWTSYIGEGSYYEILLQVYDPDGTPHGGEQRVNTTAPDYQYEPALAFVPGGGELIVTWTSDVQDGSAEGVFAREFTIGPEGAITGRAEFGVTTHTDDTQRLATVAGAGDGGFLIAWTSTGQDDDGSAGVFVQRFQRDDSDTRSAGYPWSFELPELRGGDGGEHFDLTGAGADLAAAGGNGNDVYVIDSDGDRVFEERSGGIDEIDTALAWSLQGQPAIENLRLLEDAEVSATGNRLANQLWGNDGRNLLRGFLGRDTLDGGAGEDTLAGGAGNDTYVVRDAGDLVLENADSGIDTLRSALRSTHLPDEVERLVLLGSGALDGFGNPLANVLRGSAIGNLLDGGIGADTMAGGRGDDIYRVDEAADAVVEEIGEGTDTVRTQVSYTLAAHIEQLKLDGGSAIDGTGNFLANVIEGNSAANRLDGSTGSDVLIGLAGDDTYLVDQEADTVIETAGAGFDTVIASASFAAPDNIELLRFVDPQGGARNYNGTGNGADNLLEGAAGNDELNGLGGNDTLVGLAGDDTLIGGAGVDSMAGGVGDDRYLVDDPADIAFEQDGEGIDEVESSVSFTLAAFVEHLRLTGGADIDGAGNALGNTLDGNSGANNLFGDGGDDTIDGGGEGESDTMDGGIGDDTYHVDNELDEVIEGATLLGDRSDPRNAAGGSNIDTVIAQVSYTLRANVENLVLTGDQNLAGNGNEGNNILNGNAGANLLRGLAGVDILGGGGGADTLDGGAGDDTLGGGAGDDTYIVDNRNDVILPEGSSQGIDTVQSSLNWTLGTNIEELVLAGGAANGTGNAGSNALGGSGADNVLKGLAGNDSMRGFAGSDRLFGGLGRDTLTGGADIDRFVFDTGLGAGNIDRITDFEAGTDRILLDDDIFASFDASASSTLAAAAFSSGTGNSANDADDRILYNESTGSLFYDQDGTGPLVAIRFAVLVDAPQLTAADFVIIG